MSTPHTVIHDAVIDILANMGPCTIDEVVRLLPAHDWNEAFFAVDEMSRDGRLVLRRPSDSNSGYQLSLSASHPLAKQVSKRPASVRFCVGCGYLCDEIDPEDGQSQWVEAHRYLKKYRRTWIELDRNDVFCPACAHLFACARRSARPHKVA